MASFIRGVVAGLVIGYLTAPRSGKETREKLVSDANDLKNQWDEGVAELQDQFNQLLGQAEQKVDDVKAKAYEAKGKAEGKLDQYKNEAKSAYETDKSKAKTDYNNTVDNVADATKSGINQADQALKFN
ncbi:YtxH domain-containing protein [Spirosoma sp. KUDC1026]|uniref:YtxH domain-containing protein n=1 Tax=Spirosoma sp. KUDC1026 TaxID=2745947 RepID=UPI00159B8FE9|nr:YtxH domain-containing protein [Spirosoma sp. KUDC1026]QKZ14509.1 YtxH domain-containing protein [Spirosoma sp. KUDC1026]